MRTIDPNPRRPLHPRANGRELRARFHAARERLDASQSGPRRIASRWAPLLLLLATLAIIYCTLFPFNFTVPKGLTLRQAAADWDWRAYDPADPTDWVQNVILFLPFGFAVGCLVRRLSLRDRWIAPAGLLLSALFSLCIELSQLWLPTRDSSLADILANATGGLLGALVCLLLGTWLLRGLEYGLTYGRQRLSVGRLAVAFCLVWGYTLYGPVHTYHDGHNLGNWEPYRLSLGNIPTGDRGWSGIVSKVELAAKPLTDEQARRVASGASLTDLLPGIPAIAYAPSGTADSLDALGAGPALHWVGPSRPEAGEPDATVSPTQWLETDQSPARVIDAIRGASALSLHLIFTGDLPSQNGPARIFAISPTTQLNDLTVGQEGGDLVLRMRTMLSGSNGTNPTWMVPDLFAGPRRPHDLVVTYADPMLRMYIDRARVGKAVEMPPEFFNLGRLMARPPKLPLGGIHLEAYRILFCLFCFTPLGVLLGLMWADVRTSPRVRYLFALAGLILPGLVMEAVFVVIGGRQFQPDRVLLAFVISAAAMYFTRLRFIEGRGIERGSGLAANVIDPAGR